MVTESADVRPRKVGHMRHEPDFVSHCILDVWRRRTRSGRGEGLDKKVEVVRITGNRYIIRNGQLRELGTLFRRGRGCRTKMPAGSNSVAGNYGEGVDSRVIWQARIRPFNCCAPGECKRVVGNDLIEHDAIIGQPEDTGLSLAVP